MGGLGTFCVARTEFLRAFPVVLAMGVTASCQTKWASCDRHVKNPDIGDLAELEQSEGYVFDDSQPDPTKNLMTLTQKDSQVGDHICPVTAPEACEEKVAKKLFSDVVEQCKHDVLKAFDLTSADLVGLSDIVFAVSKPTSRDCPLVFVSEGFEATTGYPASFALGRSCRFLQPTDKAINDAVNIKDRKAMREFCADPEKHPRGTEIVNLLMNERSDGLRFWNLLKMVYVDVEGEPLIFAVQHILNAYMPKVLRNRQPDCLKTEAIVDALSVFCSKVDDLRTALTERTGESIFELVTFTTEFLNSLGFTEAGRPTTMETNDRPISIRASCAEVRSRCPPSTARAATFAESRAKMMLPSSKPDMLVMRLKSIADSNKPVPSRFVAVHAGRKVKFCVANHPSVFDKIITDQTASIADIVLELRFKQDDGKEPVLAVKNASTIMKTKQESLSVIIDGHELAVGGEQFVEIGGCIALGSLLAFRVAPIRCSTADLLSAVRESSKERRESTKETRDSSKETRVSPRNSV